VLKAAEAAFRRQGYHGASLDRIAAEAGFTTGAVYSTFESKADVMLALLEERAERTRSEWAAILADAPRAEDFVAEAARRGAARLIAERDWLAVVSEFMIAIGRDEVLRGRYAALREENVSALAASVRTWARRTGEAPAMAPRSLATIVLALNRGLVLEGLVSPADVPEELCVEAHLTLLRGALASGEKASGR
jgi:AcrR family transcriptional regulator